MFIQNIQPFSMTGLAKAAKKIGTSATKILKATNKQRNDFRDNYVNKKDNSAQVGFHKKKKNDNKKNHRHHQ